MPVATRWTPSHPARPGHLPGTCAARRSTPPGTRTSRAAAAFPPGRRWSTTGRTALSRNGRGGPTTCSRRRPSAPTVRCSRWPRTGPSSSCTSPCREPDMKLTKAGALLALALAATIASGCGASGGGDKAGGTAGGPVVLRMASATSDLSNSLPVADFIRRIRVLSGGTVRIKVISQWGDYAPNNEAQVVHAVAAGTVDLGWAGSEAFDVVGVPGLRALSAPMLIDSYPLENAVLKTALPMRMLAGLSRVHVTGLAVLGDSLRHPIAVRRPLLAPADWRGLSIGTYRSGVQEQAIRALGATPVVAFGPYRIHDLATGAIQGFELDMQRYVHVVSPSSARYVTANVVLWPLFDVVFANPARLASLTAQQRGWLK